MPPRIIVAVIVAFWFASTGYLAYREWWSWRQTDAPPFTVELADEAAPQTAFWSIWRNDQKIGQAMTRMTCEKDDTVELLSSIDKLELTVTSLGVSVQIAVPKLLTIQKVTRDGKLLSIDSRIQILLDALGQKFELNAHVNGVVRDGKLYAQSSIDWIFGKSEYTLEPVVLESGSLLNPTQPHARMRVRPGQHWKITNVDPLFEAINISLLDVISKNLGAANGKLLGAQLSSPKAVLVEVDSEPRVLEHKNRQISCYIVNYGSDDLSGRTWVQVDDGKVLRQEASLFGDKLILRRED